MDKKQKDEIIRLRQEGVPGKDIAKTLRIRAGDVFRVMRSAGVSRRRNLKALTDEEKGGRQL